MLKRSLVLFLSTLPLTSSEPTLTFLFKNNLADPIHTTAGMDVMSYNVSPNNTYPLISKFDAGADGYSEHQENLHVNVIAKRTILVDGNLDDWKGVLPQPVYATGNQGPSLMEAAWLPFNKFSTTQMPGLATGYLAYDDKNFYFAAKIADDAPSPGTLRYGKWNDDDYFYPQVSYEYDPAKTLLKTEETWQEPSREKAAVFLPNSISQRSFSAWTSVAKAFAVDFNLPQDSYYNASENWIISILSNET